jgi:hypothetical protein
MKANKEAKHISGGMKNFDFRITLQGLQNQIKHALAPDKLSDHQHALR